MSIHECNARADAYIKNMGDQKFIDSLDYDYMFIDTATVLGGSIAYTSSWKMY